LLHEVSCFSVNNQLDAQFFFHVCLFISLLYMFRAAMCPSSGELIYQYDIWYMSLCIDDRLVCRCGWDSFKPAHQTVTYTQWHISDVILIQLILLMMGTWLPETCRE